MTIFQKSIVMETVMTTGDSLTNVFLVV